MSDDTVNDTYSKEKSLGALCGPTHSQSSVKRYRSWIKLRLTNRVNWLSDSTTSQPRYSPRISIPAEMLMTYEITLMSYGTVLMSRGSST